ncbi:MAG TPA: protein phosphatase CheZ [Rhodanobacteraceae bacterium]|nr:protein phosphatase CheZ [Rhodanobacteraceae bacterium]
MSAPDHNPSPAGLPPELQELLEIRDANMFEASLDALFARRQSDLFRALGHLTRDLHNSIAQVTRETAEPPVRTAFARKTLQEALTMSASAAHDTLAMTERLRPGATELRARAQAFAATATSDPSARQLAHDVGQFADACLDEFTHLVEKQSWQDLSGQRLQQVSVFIDKVEEALLQLARLARSIGGAPATGEFRAPAVTTQDDVDRLLSEFGF